MRMLTPHSFESKFQRNPTCLRAYIQCAEVSRSFKTSPHKNKEKQKFFFQIKWTNKIFGF